MTQTATTPIETPPEPRAPRGLVDLLVRPMHWLTGPILAKELRVASRRKRMYALRMLYLVLMGLILVPIWINMMDRNHYYGLGDNVSAAYRMADVGRTLVPVIIWIQFIAVQLVAMLSMSTSVSDEISRRTLGALLTTPMNAWQLVMGKLASRLIQCVSLILMSLPILALLTIFGGVQWSYVLIGLTLTLSMMLVVSSVTMFFSILNRRPYAAFLEALLTVAVLLLTPTRWDGSPPRDCLWFHI
jgi:ABC-type transport system involved in multi-copper enzyme maturation permease subunit